MTDEPTPLPIEGGAPDWSKPPTVEPSPEGSDYPRTELSVHQRPRNPTGWVASGAMFLLLIGGAVGQYLDPGEGERAQTALQGSLKYNVSLNAGPFPQMKGQIEKSRKEGLEQVLKDATEEAPESEEAARIALAAARELKKDAPNVALEKLAKSEDALSKSMVPVYGSKDVPYETVVQFLGTDSREKAINNEFAVELAKAQAKEMIGEPGMRELIIDKWLLVKFGAVVVGGLFVFVAGVICLIAFGSMRAVGKITAVGLGQLEKSDGDRLICRFALYFVAFLLLGLAGKELFVNEPLGEVSDVWSQVIIMSAVFGAVVWMLRLPLLDRRDSIGGVVAGKRPFWGLVRTGVFGYLCTVPLLVGALMLITGLSKYLPEPTHPITQEMAAASGLDWLAIALTAAVLAPLLEELGFRGMLYPALATQIRKPWVAMLACGLLFAAIHPQGPLAWPALATTGAAAAALRYYTGSLVPSITLHVVHNAMILVIGTLIG